MKKILLLGFIFLLTATGSSAAQGDREKVVKEIRLESFQFGFSPDPIRVKKGDVVRFIVTSRDVPHGVYIAEYGVNVSVKRGEEKTVEFVADKAGTFEVLCSVYCGPGHSRMKSKLIVEE